MRFFDIGQEAHGFIAVGQIATGVFAFGQMATGFVAVGQLARGVQAGPELRDARADAAEPPGRERRGSGLGQGERDAR